MQADDDRAEGGSNISRLVTTQRVSMKEIFRARKGITAMMPGKTDFVTGITHTHTHIIHFNILKYWIPCTVSTFWVRSASWHAHICTRHKPIYVCVQVFNLRVCVSALCVQIWDTGVQGLFDQAWISCSQGCPWNVKINKFVVEVHTHFILRHTHCFVCSPVYWCKYSSCPYVCFFSATEFMLNDEKIQLMLLNIGLILQSWTVPSRSTFFSFH